MPEVPFPTDEGAVELLLQNLAVKLPTYQVQLALTLADTVRSAANAANYDYLRNVALQVTDSKEAFFQYKASMFTGPIEGNFAPPVLPIVTLPEAAEPGIVPWTKGLIKRIKAATGYTQQIGEDLGLVTADSESLNPADIVPTLTLKALNDGDVEIKFSKQGLDAMRVDWRKKGEGAWLLAGVYTSSPGVHSHPSTDGEPEGREYRGILLKKNAPVSQYSPTYNVVTTP